MKHVSKLTALTLVAAALFLSSCAKKPVRSTPTDTATGGTLTPEPMPTFDPNTPAIPGRDGGTVPDANKSVVEPIYFALDRAAVAPAERPKLDAAIKWLADNPTKSLVMVGHCDWRGTAEYNLGLGDRRANSVKNFLVSKGADPKRLETLSKGSTDAKQGGGESEWQKDRRVDFVELVKQ